MAAAVQKLQDSNRVFRKCHSKGDREISYLRIQLSTTAVVSPRARYERQESNATARTEVYGTPLAEHELAES